MPNPNPAEIRLDDDRLYEFLEQFVTNEKLNRFGEILQKRTRFLTAVFENVDKAHNVSACIRSCEAFGLQDVHLLGAKDAVLVKKDISTGAGQWMTVQSFITEDTNRGSVTEPQIESYYDRLRQEGYRIVATTPGPDSVSLTDYQPDQPTALIFGSELLGLSDAAIKHADQRLTIPMRGLTRSFNLSVSVALCLYELRQRVEEMGIDLSLADDEKKTLRKIWMRQAIGYKFESYLRRYDEENNQ